MDYWTTLLIIPLLGLLYYHFSKKTNLYWADRGVKGPPAIPVLGNLVEYRRKGQMVVEKEWPAKYGKIYGMYRALDPVLTIVDAELIKQVLIKDFHVFVNRCKNPSDHEIWKSSLFASEDKQWKRIRAIINPSFTTGKLRGMHAMMNRCVDRLADYFNTVIENDGGKMNAKEVILGFTIDVIASTSFGTETNAYGDRSKPNPFVENSKLFDVSMIRLFSNLLLPKKFNIMVGNSAGMSDKRLNFFIDLSREIIKQRKKDKGDKKRNDLVQLMLNAYVYEEQLNSANYDKLAATAEHDSQEETNDAKVAQNGSIKRSLTENEIIAQCILFFAAGFETTATTISNCLYNLAINPQAQDRLYNELSTALDGIKYNSEQYYETVMVGIPYLDAVIKETLRMAPPDSRIQRRVGIDGYNLAGIPLDKDIHVEIGVLAVHYSADYYPDPERFEPDRFMPDNKHLLTPYTYLPFSAGPRNCIGMRFAYQKMKLCLAQIIQQFRFHPTPETKIPFDFLKIGIMTADYIPLRVEKR